MNRWNRLQVRWVEVKIAGADNQVFRIRCFQNNQTARQQHTSGLRDQRLCILERQVFHQMEGRYQCHAGVGQGAQYRQRIGRFHVQATLAARREHPFIQVDAMRRKSGLVHQLEPFAAAATEVERAGAGIECRQLVDKRRIRPQAALDQVARTAVALFERAVKIVAHRRISTVGSIQLVPIKSLRFMFMTINRHARSRHSKLSVKWVSLLVKAVVIE
jgi:hypothetical protein